MGFYLLRAYHPFLWADVNLPRAHIWETWVISRSKVVMAIGERVLKLTSMLLQWIHILAMEADLLTWQVNRLAAFLFKRLMKSETNTTVRNASGRKAATWQMQYTNKIKQIVESGFQFCKSRYTLHCIWTHRNWIKAKILFLLNSTPKGDQEHNLSKISSQMSRTKWNLETTSPASSLPPGAVGGDWRHILCMVAENPPQ